MKSQLDRNGLGSIGKLLYFDTRLASHLLIARGEKYEAATLMPHELSGIMRLQGGTGWSSVVKSLLH